MPVKYETFDELLDAVLETADATGGPVNWESLELGKLCRVYRNAFDNPPDGVIGVGVFTYAEQKLAEYQEESN
jgi:hypothetical protein